MSTSTHSNHSESVKRLLRALAFEGEVEVGKFIDRTGLSIDDVQEASARSDLFEVWALENGNGEPMTIKLTPDGYQIARSLLREERAVAPNFSR